MTKKWFFLTATWSGRGVMFTGGLGAIYCTVNTVWYITQRGNVIPYFGSVPMAFDTSIVLLFYGLAFFLDGVENSKQ